MSPPSASTERATTAYHPLPEFRDIDNVNEESTQGRRRTKSCFWLLFKVTIRSSAFFSSSLEFFFQIVVAILAVVLLITGLWQYIVVKLGHSGCSAARMEALEPEYGKFDLLPKVSNARFSMRSSEVFVSPSCSLSNHIEPIVHWRYSQQMSKGR